MLSRTPEQDEERSHGGSRVSSHQLVVQRKIQSAHVFGGFLRILDDLVCFVGVGILARAFGTRGSVREQARSLQRLNVKVKQDVRHTSSV